MANMNTFRINILITTFLEGNSKKKRKLFVSIKMFHEEKFLEVKLFKAKFCLLLKVFNELRTTCIENPFDAPLILLSFKFD